AVGRLGLRLGACNVPPPCGRPVTGNALKTQNPFPSRACSATRIDYAACSMTKIRCGRGGEDGRATIGRRRNARSGPNVSLAGRPGAFASTQPKVGPDTAMIVPPNLVGRS